MLYMDSVCTTGVCVEDGILLLRLGLPAIHRYASNMPWVLLQPPWVLSQPRAVVA